MTCYVQEIKSAHDIGLFKLARAIDGAIHMGLGSEMHNGIWLVIGKDSLNSRFIANICLNKVVAGGFFGLIDGF